CKNEAEQKFIADTVSEFINQNLDIEINRIKSHLRHNEIHFLGFKLIKSKRSIWILFDNPKEYTDHLKKFKLYTYTQCQAFMKWFKSILNHFDIVNDMGDFLDRVEQKLYRE
ncbi:MAG: hypothetical protein IJG33_11995, partial [Selenomonadaceae bacterium]|nr:hypothetical protein [Selenomonadaceae bacterium]